jgi:hypothetical protein
MWLLKTNLNWDSPTVSHKINIKTKQPVFVKLFKITDAYEKEIMTHISEWRKQSVIDECSSPHSSSVFCVSKKGGTLQIVQDLRQIKRASYKDK